jgi:hypothetical protein
MNWETGPENLRIVSVGTLRFSSGLPEKTQKLWLGYNAKHIPLALMNAVAWQQDYLCRCLGNCIYGDPLDSEIGDLLHAPLPGRAWFSYVRYNKSYGADALRKVLAEQPKLMAIDNVDAIKPLRKIGCEYAKESVQLEHLI